MRRIKRFLGLPPSDRRLLMRAFLWLTVADVILRIAALRRLVWSRLVLAPVPSSDSGPDVLRQARDAARWLEVAARHHLVPAHCLHRSLALQVWLRREGVASELRIGARKEDGSLKAHAWVELNGVVVADAPGSTEPFAVLSRPVTVAYAASKAGRFQSAGPNLVSTLDSSGGSRD